MVPLALLIAALNTGCAGCDEAPPEVDAGEPEGGVICVTDDECGQGAFCVGGICEVSGEPEPAPGEPSPTPDAEPGAEPEPTEDAGPPPAGAIEVLPDLVIEFGAQLLGVPVEREVTILNTGNADVTLLAILLDDDSGEFSSSIDGTLQQILAPGDSVVVTVAHTPADGTPDEAELKILHDAGENLTSVTLFAEFKGDAAFGVHEDVASMDENIVEVDFGEVSPGVLSTRTLFLRNLGRSDSILDVNDLSLTPANGAFAIANLDEDDFPIALPSWASGLCPDADFTVCPQGADACVDDVCVDEDGLPLHALAVDIAFSPGTFAEQAILTIDHNAPGESQQHDVALVGTPTQPDLVMTPSTIAFGTYLVGAAPGEMAFSIGNAGDGPLVITRVDVPENANIFSVDFDAPVPTQDGHPAITVAPGAPPLTGTVTFTPEAIAGYTGFLVIHSNDGDDEALSVSVSGDGLVCPANSQVTPEGECGCSEGFVECAEGCVAESAVACGASCTDCTTVVSGIGTAAQCVDGGCAYECTEQYYDLDGDLAANPSSPGWNGCEYLCPRAVPQPEQCNSIDDNCDGIADEGLDTDPGDDQNPATQTLDTCSAPLGNQEVDGTVQINRTLYPVGDEDWFAIRSIENDDDICAPCIDGGGSCESYRTTFTLLDVPQGRDYILEIRRAEDGCASTPLSVGDSFTYTWEKCPNEDSFFFPIDCLAEAAGFPLAGAHGGCGFNDFEDFIVRVRADGAQPQTCESYRLQVTHEAL